MYRDCDVSRLARLRAPLIILRAVLPMREEGTCGYRRRAWRRIGRIIGAADITNHAAWYRLLAFKAHNKSQFFSVKC